MGKVAVRHRLTELLIEEGGHIGYAVRPTRRRWGHATRALGLALVEARSLGAARPGGDVPAVAAAQDFLVGGIVSVTVPLDRADGDWVLLRVADPAVGNATPGPDVHPGNLLGVAYSSPW